MANNFYPVKKTINGVDYVAQFNGLSQIFDMRNRCKAVYDGVVDMDEGKMTQYMLDHVIVEPKGLTIDSFESVEDLTAIQEFCNDVMSGKFRTPSDKGGAGKGSKK